MKGFSLTHGGIAVMLIGYTLIDVLGFSDACSGEITSKLVEYGPLVPGAVMAWVGRMRAKGPTTLGGFRA